MNFLQFLTENYVVLFEFAGILIMLGISAHTPTRMKRLTFTAILLIFVQLIVYSLELWTQSFATLSFWRPFLTATQYSLYPFILYVMTMITVPSRLTWYKNLLLLLPAIAVIPLYYTSQRTHLVCWFHVENKWAPGPLRYLPYAVFALYLILFLVRNVVFLRSEAKQIRWILYFIVFTPAAGVPLFLLSDDPINYSLLFTTSIVLYYLFIYLHFARFDALTGLLNRQVYYSDMHNGADKIDYAVSIDLNDLKHINDGYGHDAGDVALKTVASVLKKHVGRHGTVYRIGGDEFVIFYRNVDEGDVVRAIAKMREEMEKTPYVCAFGYAKKESLHSVEDAVRFADREMYDDKTQIKKFQEAEKRARGAAKRRD
ncbi:MAG: GGDEF domain-containing protein [Clostridia bacterium]|nr:GGDEF domain-containing protein [Clostridia bacterium]